MIWLAVLDVAPTVSMDPLTQIGSQLFVHGPIGILCLILMWACRYLYLGKEELAKRCDLIQREHQQEILALMERHIGKAETWVEKGNALATNLNAVLESISKRQV